MTVTDAGATSATGAWLICIRTVRCAGGEPGFPGQRVHGGRDGGDDHRQRLCVRRDGGVRDGRGDQVTVLSGTQLTAVAPAQAAGTHNVYVTTHAGTSATVNADRCSYVAPTVTGVSPDAGSTAGSGSSLVTITGTGFVSGDTVAFGSTAASGVTVVSATKITAKAPAGSAGSVDVTVTMLVPTSATGVADRYAYGAPAVSQVSPASGSTAGGTAVTITGTASPSGATVVFGTVAATKVTVLSGTQLTAVAPAQAAGTQERGTLTTHAGTSATVNADRYSYVAPTVTGVSPDAGSTAGSGSSVGDDHRHRVCVRGHGGVRINRRQRGHGGVGDEDHREGSGGQRGECRRDGH